MITSPPIQNRSSHAPSYPNPGSRDVGNTSFTPSFSPQPTPRNVSTNFPCLRRIPPIWSESCVFLSGGESDFKVPRRFFEHVPCFTGVERVTILGYGRWETFRQVLGGLPQPVTSVYISRTGTVGPLEIRDILARLPNLNDLSLSGSLFVIPGDKLRGMGTVLRGDFGGQLRLLKRLAVTEIVNTLLEVPTGLHFTMYSSTPCSGVSYQR